MALIFIDSWDHYSPSQSTRKWTSGSPNNIDSANGRFGLGANMGTFGNVSKTFGAEYHTLTAGVAVRLNAFANDPIEFDTPPSTGGVASFGNVGDGRYTYKTDGGVSAPSTFVLSLGVWYYIELNDTVHFVFIDSTHYSITHTGSIRVNEVTIASGSFSRTVTGAFPGDRGYSSLYLTGPGGSANCSMDDFYCTDGEFLGDIKIAVLYPNAPGDSAMWIPSTGGAANWTMVKEHPADDDVTTVSSANANDKDLYNLDDIGAGFVGTIKGVQALWLTKKSDAGAAKIKGVWKSSGTEIVQSQGLNFVPPDGFPPSYVAYSYSIEPERSSLFTSTDWTVPEINALQLGVIRTV